MFSGHLKNGLVLKDLNSQNHRSFKRIEDVMKIFLAHFSSIDYDIDTPLAKSIPTSMHNFGNIKHQIVRSHY